MCPCIFGYECPQIASGWGGAGEGEGWRESNKGALLSAHFLMFSSLWRNKSRGVKHSPLAQLGHSCTLCATRKTKTYWTVNITWLTTVFSPLVNISSLFSCLACWNTKGNVSPDKLGIMTFLAGQLLVSGHVSPRCLKPQIFSFSLCLIFLCPLISSLCYNPWAAHFMFCVFIAPTAISHNWEISDLEKAIMAFTYPKIPLTNVKMPLQKGIGKTNENKCYFFEIYVNYSWTWCLFIYLFSSPDSYFQKK